jgi:hypothetical protein
MGIHRYCFDILDRSFDLNYFPIEIIVICDQPFDIRYVRYILVYMYYIIRQYYRCVLSRQLLSMGNLYVPDIEYHYTVMSDERDVFVWEQTDRWEQCDQICSGTLRETSYRSVSRVRGYTYNIYFVCSV